MNKDCKLPNGRKASLASEHISPITPGELLKDGFLDPMGISQYRLAKEIGVPASRIGQIIAGKRDVTVDTDLRLCRFFGLSDGYWMRAQVACDAEVAAREIVNELAHIALGASKRQASN